ncbi:MAG TPA: EamA family transporter [Candidatus Limnocylindria bacterium]|nr:EamA family transporter [Candidatus Limnocylindria bacterium]
MTTREPSGFALGYLAALGSAAFFAAGGAIAKSAFDRGVPPSVLAEFRVLFAFLAFLVIVAVWRPRDLRVRREDILWFAAFGVFGMGAVQWLYYEAIQRIPIAVALVIEYTAVIFVLVWARLRGRKVGRALWYAGALSLVGCFFAAGAYDAALRAVSTVGVALAALDALLFTSYFILGERLATRYSAWTLAVYGFGFALLAWTIGRPVWTLPWTTTPPDVWLRIAGVVIIAAVIPFALGFIALRRLPAARVSIVATSEPFIAGVIAWVLLEQALQVPQLVGGVLVLAGIVIAQTHRPTGNSV